MSGPIGRVWTGVLRVGPHRGDHRVALRAAVSVAIPLLVLWAIGRLDLSIYASFGAFAALYGRMDGYGDRLRMQAAAGGVILASMVLGTGLSVAKLPAIVSIGTVAAVAAGVTLLSHALRWHPPGALFVVFAAGATAAIPATPASLLAAVVVGGASAAFALLVTVAFAVAAARRFPPIRATRRVRALGADAWETAIAVAVASLIAGGAGLLLVGSHWYWAMVGAIAAVGVAHVKARIIRGLQRLAGTLIGVLLAAGILALHLPPIVVIALAVLFQAGAELFIGRNYGIAMVFITPLALLMVQLASATPPDALLRDRVLDTVIGVAAGTLVAVVSAGMRSGWLRRATRL